MKKFKHNYRAFTLSEVLIALVITGVIAALTTGVVIENYQKREAITGLKKCYTMLLNAATKYQAEKGLHIDYFDTSLAPKAFMEEYFLPYIQTMKYCGTFQDCYGNSRPPKAIDGTTLVNVPFGVILADGKILGCYGQNTSIVIFVDINGRKGLNRSGRDIFNFLVFSKDADRTDANCETTAKNVVSGVYLGSYDSCYLPHATRSREQLLASSAVHRACNKNAPAITEGSGDACALVIAKDSWQIKEDYPW